MVVQDEPKALECFHSAGFGVCPKRSCCGHSGLRSPLARRRLTTLRSKQIFNELNSPNAPLRVAVTWVLFFDLGPKDRAVHGESGGGVHRIHFAHTFWRTQRIAHFISRSP